MKKTNTITIIIILIILAISIYALNKKNGGVNEELARCIASKSTLYVQLGCSHCETQKKMFGKNYKYLNVVDCFYNKSKCVEEEIKSTPTWIINGQRIEGVQKIETLKKLIKC